MLLAKSAGTKWTVWPFVKGHGGITRQGRSQPTSAAKSALSRRYQPRRYQRTFERPLSRDDHKTAMARLVSAHDPGGQMPDPISLCDALLPIIAVTVAASLFCVLKTGTFHRSCQFFAIAALREIPPMAVKHVIEGVQIVPMGMANAFLIEGDDGLTLIDAGYPGKEAIVFGAIRGVGGSPGQLKHLIFTHGHPDHIGSAAAIVRETGARTYMHPLDIPMAESGGPFRPMQGAPGFLRPAANPWRNTAHRRGIRGYSYAWPLRGTGRAAVASGTNAVRGRCLHERHGPRRSRRL
jgi:hypothetical protein